mgnify:CR=1 FL=1
MTDIPVSNKDLDEVIYKVTRDYIEEKAINGIIESVEEEIVQETLKDVVFIIDRYMTYINEVISASQLTQASKIDLN